MKLMDTESRFTEIYRSNYWNNMESISGPGSTLQYTQNIRAQLPLIFQKLEVRKLFDAPCGDFNWMRTIVEQSNVEYVGADIVAELISDNQQKYGNDKIRFQQLNIAQGDFPHADIWICRDCFFHLSYNEILRSLENFERSGIKYLLTSTHIVEEGFRNSDIQSGGFRLINMFETPFHFDRKPVLRFDDYIEPFPAREMCVWTSTQVSAAIPQLRKVLKSDQ